MRSASLRVFTKTSVQQALISPDKPRAIYFNDDVYVGFVAEDGGFIDIVKGTTPRFELFENDDVVQEDFNEVKHTGGRIAARWFINDDWTMTAGILAANTWVAFEPLRYHRRMRRRARLGLAENGGGNIGVEEAAMCIHILEKW